MAWERVVDEQLSRRASTPRAIVSLGLRFAVRSFGGCLPCTHHLESCRRLARRRVRLCASVGHPGDDGAVAQTSVDTAQMNTGSPPPPPSRSIELTAGHSFPRLICLTADFSDISRDGRRPNPTPLGYFAAHYCRVRLKTAVWGHEDQGARSISFFVVARPTSNTSSRPAIIPLTVDLASTSGVIPTF
jgi:hypothetical protein